MGILEVAVLVFGGRDAMAERRASGGEMPE